MKPQLLMLPPNTAASFQYTDGIVCACCHRQINSFSLFGPKADIAGIEHRMYLGYCLTCDKAFEVEQFMEAGVWKILRYRIEDGLWQQMQPLPAVHTGTQSPNHYTASPNHYTDAPILRTGPGGDFTMDMSEAELESLLENAVSLQNQLARFLIGLVDLISAKKQRQQHG